MNEEKSVYIHTHIYMYNEIVFSHKKEGKPAICNSMDKSF